MDPQPNLETYFELVTSAFLKPLQEAGLDIRAVQVCKICHGVYSLTTFRPFHHPYAEAAEVLKESPPPELTLMHVFKSAVLLLGQSKC